MRKVIKNHYYEKEMLIRRVLFLLALIIIASLGLIVRLFYLQVEEYDSYAKKSENNQFKLEPIIAKRGLILDRNGKILAENIPAHRLEITPSKSNNLDETLEKLGKSVNLSKQTTNEFLKSLPSKKYKKPIPLKMKLSEKDIAKFYIDKYKYPEAEIQSYLIRNYPEKKYASGILGYVARINTNNLNDEERLAYQINPFLGIIGIEKAYENILRGTHGYRKLEVNASGKYIDEIAIEKPQPGSNITLTIDIELQKAAQKAFGTELGSAVVINPSNGEILALVNNPSYDANLFVKGISQKEIKELSDSYTKPMFNRALQGQFPLASTIKPFLALGALERELINKDDTIEDKGSYVYPGTTHVYRDWKLDGHGKVNLSKAIKISCDTYFYELSVKMGIDNISDILQEFGFGHKTGVDLIGESNGLVANPIWKKDSKGSSWFVGDTILSGIGQGFMLTTPIQLAQATAILANHGNGYVPHLVKDISSDAERSVTEPIKIASVKMTDKNWNIVTEAMSSVVSEHGGTGFRFGYEHNYTIAGKTGTAQLYRNEKQYNDSDKVPKRIRNHSLFIGFSPIEDAEIAVAVIAENTEIAPKIARIIFDKYYELKA